MTAGLFNILITFDRMMSYKVIKERPAHTRTYAHRIVSRLELVA